MNELLICGVDIGGSHITAALVNMNSRQVLQHTWRRSAVDAQAGTATIMECWCKTIKDSFSACGIKPTVIGIAMPGPFDYAEGISLMKNQNKYDALYKLNIKDLLAMHLGIERNNIIIVNDALSFLQGEIFNGAAKYYNNVMGITLGTGFGSAKQVNNKTTDADLWCSPFLEGIAEDYFSSRWFVKRYLELCGKQVNNVKELMDMINQDTNVQFILDEFANNLSLFLAPLIQVEEIEMVVMGGNISNGFDYFSKQLKTCLSTLVPGVKIEKNVLGESAALIGAASNCSNSKMFGYKAFA